MLTPMSGTSTSLTSLQGCKRPQVPGPPTSQGILRPPKLSVPTQLVMRYSIAYPTEQVPTVCDEKEKMSELWVSSCPNLEYQILTSVIPNY